MTTIATTTRRPGKALNITLWTVQSVLAAFFAFAAVPKVLGDPTTAQMMTQIGLAEWMGYFIGACEIAGAVGLLVPRLTGVAAVGLSLLMIGATITNSYTMGAGAAAMTVVLAGAFAAIAWARRDSITRLIKR